jgi:Zn-dependent alcohol dehydrogenase
VKAAVCRAFNEPLVIEDVTLRDPKGTEVRVEIAACAVCHSDIHFMEGAWGGRLPAVYGHEAAGIVRAVGPQVDDIAIGDHVAVTLLRSCGRCYYCSRGTPNLCEKKFPLDRVSPLTGSDGKPIAQGLRTAAFAEEVVVEESQVAKIPKAVPFDVASLLSCGVITGFGAVVNTAKVPVGASVIVIGTGGVGLNCVQGAALSGANPVIALDLQPEKRTAAQAFGATEALDPANAGLEKQVKALTGGRGADFVFVSVGSTRAMKQGLSLLGKDGTLVVVGMPASGAMSEYEPVELAFRSQRIIGSLMGSTRLRIDLPRLLDLYRQGRLKLDELISGRYRLPRINEAIDSARGGQALRNVIIV